ncbi:hypothetical protein EVAR_16466_1 [Eumeta japonica]|uniref:Uncharacterized protein n=1 Tax=Eumeta variegata TaxID=151549 RepID=A0A4C1ULZ0_EUMVA|nr:hypothetical protein EVAR_16466_1 [Eumeta japonica]
MLTSAKLSTELGGPDSTTPSRVVDFLTESLEHHNRKAKKTTLNAPGDHFIKLKALNLSGVEELELQSFLRQLSAGLRLLTAIVTKTVAISSADCLTLQVNADIDTQQSIVSKWTSLLRQPVYVHFHRGDASINFSEGSFETAQNAHVARLRSRRSTVECSTRRGRSRSFVGLRSSVYPILDN